MNNEVMARAITGIDDDIIESALDKSVPFHKGKIKKGFILVAACMVIIISLSLYIKGINTPKVYAYGSQIENDGIVIPNYDTALASRMKENAQISVVIEVEGDKNVKLSTDDGIFEVFGENSDTAVYSGDFYKTKSPVTVKWTVKSPDTENVYKLKINNGYFVVKLMYDNETDKWILIKD